MNPPVLRQDYQQPLVGKLRKSIGEGYKCPLVVASTGSGKTIMFCYITYFAALKNNPVLINAHRKELIRQISMSLAKYGVEHQVIAPENRIRQIKVAQFKAFGRSFVSPSALVMVGSVQTVVSRFKIIDATIQRANNRSGKKQKLIIIMDEGHHVVENTQWGDVMDRYHVEGDGIGMLFSASPDRLDGTGLGKGHGGYADIIIEAPPMSWLIEHGYLSTYRAYTAGVPIDMSGVHTKMGEYVTAEAEQRADKPSITGDAISHYRKYADGMLAVVFCVSIKHSEHVAAEFNAAGIPAAHIDGGIDDTVRDQAIIDFADGKIKVLTQVGLVSEGFDLGSIAQKDVTIDCIIDLAPTQSLVNAMQRWGRALRPKDGKAAIILDHAGNIARHGFPDDEREWSLEGSKKSGRKKDPNAGPDVHIRTCPKCFSIIRPEPVCYGIKPDGSVCGYEFPAQDRKVEQLEGELVEMTKEHIEEMRRQRMMQQGAAQTIDDLVAQGMSRSRAEHILQARAQKAELVESILADAERMKQEVGAGLHQQFGVTVSDVKRMKPKELRDIKARIDEILGTNLPFSIEKVFAM